MPMNNFTQSTKLKELIQLDKQIDSTIADIGRLSSFNQSSTEILSKIKLEKIYFLRSLKEKKNKLIKLMENHIEATF
ncbi:MAG: hypothetical protein DRI54_02330 [Bacteroidetes bacterium]|nr:MAG: hypothetical protein DRI54_02330 [Bacteroidota bacterium]